MSTNKTRAKNKQKVSVRYDLSKQPSIRNFFSASLKRDFKGGCNTNVELSAHDLQKVAGEKKSFVANNDVVTSNECSRNDARSVLSGNVKCPPNSFDHGKDHHEKRKHDKVEDEVLNDLLDELENSSPEDYIYSQALLSCSGNPKNNSSTKRMKMSPMSSKNNSNKKLERIDRNEVVEESSSADDNSKSKSNTMMEATEALTYEKNVKRGESLNFDQIHKQKCSSFIQSAQSKKGVNTADFIDIENLAEWFDNDDWNGLPSQNTTLSLALWTYCRVNAIHISSNSVVLKLEKFSKTIMKSSSLTTCILKGCWLDTPIKVDDVICVKAYFDSKNGHWLVDNEQGFIIVHPDILITGTGVVGSLFCLRQSVLNYIFPSSDPPNIAMVIGSLVHELLQEVLKKQLYSLSSMKQTVDDLVKSRRTLFLAYECNVTLTMITSELNNFLPKISSFVETYISNKKGKQKTWSGEILEILSIEENFWIPQLGIKGKTDLILKTKKDDKIKILPLELKTGRASNSSEHRGQIILYSMMMCETGVNVDSGLLFYLRENKLMEIKPKHPERSGLMGMRNNLVNYIVANETLNLISETQFELPILPEPINHHSGCSKCPLLTVCSASLSEENRKNFSSQNPLKELSVKSLEHVSQSHINYVFFWLGLLKLEELERKRNRSFDISDLWHLDVFKREERGYCVSKLCIENVQEFGSKFLHKMKRIINDGYDFTTSGLVEGDYIVISEGSRYAIAAGYVHMISEHEIFLKLDRKLDKCGNDTFYVVDKYSMYDSLLGFNTSGLLLLFENSVQAQKLRSLIIDMQIPVFSSSSLTESEHEEKYLQHLNSAQKTAILRTITTQDYILIKGMPGTGKTATIVALVKLLTSLKYSILITSHTHSAVDNILLRLKDCVDFLRLGSSVRVHDLLQQYCEDYILEKNNFQTVEDLENFYNKMQVVAVTCMGCSHALFRKRQFDYCIVDEATQVLQPSIIKSLYSSKRFVLIGDPEQLPPVVQSRQASALGFGESLFKRLDRPEVTSVLNLQYRMNSQIMKLANLFTYCNTLKCANDTVASATIDVKNPLQLDLQEIWMQLPLSKELHHSVIVLNTAFLSVAQSQSEYSNENEAIMTCNLVEKFQKICDTKHDIGIIAPYREQVELLRKMANLRKFQVEINTVDQYQGRDKDIVIYSCTKTSSTRDSGILSDKRRLTVAITRAKRKLIIIGNVDTLQTYSTFKELFSYISKENIVDMNFTF